MSTYKVASCNQVSSQNLTISLYFNYLLFLLNIKGPSGYFLFVNLEEKHCNEYPNQGRLAMSIFYHPSPQAIQILPKPPHHLP